MIGTLLRIRYEILQELESSPIFEIYRARDRVSSKEIKIRLIKPPCNSETNFLNRIRDVVSENTNYTHAGLEKLLDLDEHEGQKFIVSEISAGVNLQEKVKKLAPFSAPIVIASVVSLCEALQVLHDKEQAHGDVSSANISVTQDGKVRIALCGMWKAYGASKTAGISVLPTMAPYLSPEVTEGAMPSPRSDIYALGVLMFEMLTGRYPFSADTPIAMALKHTTAPVPSLKLANPGVPAVLEEIVKKCMSKVPHDRYLDARALSSDLRVLQDALRFGKSISWPIGKGSTVSDASPPPGPQVVAPRMSAITKERKENADKNSAPAEDFEYGDTATKILSVLAYLLLLVIIVMIGAWAFTNLMGQKKVRVPNVIGRNAATVSKDFKDLHLKMQTESTESDKPEGTILSTDPADGIKVDENSVVLARISTGSKFVEIPDSILGIEENEAKDLLSKIGLKVKVVRGPSKNVAEGTVFDVRPKPRQKLKKGTDVKLYVSNGERGSTGTDRGERAHYTVKFRLNTEQSVQVQIDVVDSSGIPRSIFDRRVFPLNLVDAECDARGDEVLFKIYYNGELVHQVTSKPTGAKNQDDTSTTGDEPSPNGVDTRDAPPPSENQ